MARMSKPSSCDLEDPRLKAVATYREKKPRGHSSKGATMKRTEWIFDQQASKRGANDFPDHSSGGGRMRGRER